MSSIKKAAEHFKKADYQEAYRLYKEAGKIFGNEIVATNLLLCEKRLKLDLSVLNKKPDTEKSILNEYFDHIYLVNLEHKLDDRLTVGMHLKKHGVKFEWVKAVNGYEGEPLKKFENYVKKPVGSMQRYSDSNHLEITRNKHFIESAGAIGYIYTYLKILKDAKTKGYKKFLILEDDVILIENFENQFKRFIESIPQNWKVLQLGASQYGWEHLDDIELLKAGYYLPGRSEDSKQSTCGSFAIAFDQSVVDEVIEAQESFEAPFDHLPMSEIYNSYKGKCFVSYPNIVMPDVSGSSIRHGRDQVKHSALMKWQLEKFDFPLSKPSIAVVITDKNNLKYFSSFSDASGQPFNLRLFFNTKDGIRPLHNKELLDFDINNELKSADESLIVSESDFVTTLAKDKVLSERDIAEFLEYKLGFKTENSSCLEEINVIEKSVVKGRVSVIIPTYKRPKNLRNALKSVVKQDYHDIEVIVVSDNGQDSEFNSETQEIVDKFAGVNPNCEVKLMLHSVNRNGAAARNTGFTNSTGEFICYLDDDDVYLPGRLSKSIEKLKATPKTTGAVYCGFLGWNSPENDLNRYKEGDLTLEIFMLDYMKHYLHTNTATYKREAVLAINGFDESYRRHQDLEFNIRFFQFYSIKAVKEALVRLNPEPSDVSNKVFNMDMLELKEKFLSQFESIISSLPTCEREVYDKHWYEVSRYLSDKVSVAKTLKNNYKNGMLQVVFALNEDVK